MNPGDRARQVREARNAARRLAEQKMMEQAALRDAHERLQAAAWRVVEAWEGAPECDNAELDKACRELAASLD